MARVLLYDADCGFCTRSAGWVARADPRLDVVPLQQWPHLARHGITPEAATEAVHLVDGNRVLVGHRAIAGSLVESAYFPVRWIGRLAGARLLDPLGRRVYAWVAANRYRLPGSTDACARP